LSSGPSVFLTVRIQLLLSICAEHRAAA